MQSPISGESCFSPPKNIICHWILQSKSHPRGQTTQKCLFLCPVWKKGRFTPKVTFQHDFLMSFPKYVTHELSHTELPQIHSVLQKGTETVIIDIRMGTVNRHLA